jgi:hypothetical protein
MTDITYDIARQRAEQLQREAANERAAQEALRTNKRPRANNWLRRLMAQDNNRMDTGEKN